MGTNKVEYFYNLLLDRINLGMKKFMFQNVRSSNSPVQELITTEVIYIQYKNPLNLEDVKQLHCNYYLSYMVSILIIVPDVTVAKTEQKTLMNFCNYYLLDILSILLPPFLNIRLIRNFNRDNI